MPKTTGAIGLAGEMDAVRIHVTAGALLTVKLSPDRKVPIDPVLEIDRVRQVPGNTIVLVDESLSMSLKDPYPTEAALGSSGGLLLLGHRYLPVSLAGWTTHYPFATSRHQTSCVE